MGPFCLASPHGYIKMISIMSTRSPSSRAVSKQVVPSGTHHALGPSYTLGSEDLAQQAVLFTPPGKIRACRCRSGQSLPAPLDRFQILRSLTRTHVRPHPLPSLPWPKLLPLPKLLLLPLPNTSAPIAITPAAQAAVTPPAQHCRPHCHHSRCCLSCCCRCPSCCYSPCPTLPSTLPSLPLLPKLLLPLVASSLPLPLPVDPLLTTSSSSASSLISSDELALRLTLHGI